MKREFVQTSTKILRILFLNFEETYPYNTVLNLMRHVPYCLQLSIIAKQLQTKWDISHKYVQKISVHYAILVNHPSPPKSI